MCNSPRLRSAARFRPSEADRYPLKGMRWPADGQGETSRSMSDHRARRTHNSQQWPRSNRSPSRPSRTRSSTGASRLSNARAIPCRRPGSSRPQPTSTCASPNASSHGAARPRPRRGSWSERRTFTSSLSSLGPQGWRGLCVRAGGCNGSPGSAGCWDRGELLAVPFLRPKGRMISALALQPELRLGAH